MGLLFHVFHVLTYSYYSSLFSFSSRHRYRQQKQQEQEQQQRSMRVVFGTSRKALRLRLVQLLPEALPWVGCRGALSTAS